MIDREQWDRIHKLLIQIHRGKRRKARATKASLFTGLVFDPAGNSWNLSGNTSLTENFQGIL